MLNTLVMANTGHLENTKFNIQYKYITPIICTCIYVVYTITFYNI